MFLNTYALTAQMVKDFERGFSRPRPRPRFRQSRARYGSAGAGTRLTMAQHATRKCADGASRAVGRRDRGNFEQFHITPPARNRQPPIRPTTRQRPAESDPAPAQRPWVPTWTATRQNYTIYLITRRESITNNARGKNRQQKKKKSRQKTSLRVFLVSRPAARRAAHVVGRSVGRTPRYDSHTG